MTKVEIPIPELGIFAATRAMLGVGVGLLVAGHMSDTRRKVAGRTLLAIGALSTILLAIDLMSRRRRALRA